MLRLKHWQIKAVIIFIAGSCLGVFVNHDLLKDVCFSDAPGTNAPTVCSQKVVLDPVKEFKVPFYEKK